MAGNEDEDTDTWATGLMTALKGAVDNTVRHLVKRCEEDCDTAEADRRARAIHNVARAVQTIVTVVRKAQAAPTIQEDGMRDEDDRDDLCPEAVEGARDELRSRLEHLQSVVEQKCVVAGLERPDPDGGFGLDP